MTREETIKVLAILKAAYPNSYKGMTKEEANGTVMIWSTQFANIPADIVLMAVNKVISTKAFPPAISEVKAKIESLYWESYEIINDKFSRELMPKEEFAKYQRIYEITRDLKRNPQLEPTLGEMMNGTSQLYLNGGQE